MVPNTPLSPPATLLELNTLSLRHFMLPRKSEDWDEPDCEITYIL